MAYEFRQNISVPGDIIMEGDLVTSGAQYVNVKIVTADDHNSENNDYYLIQDSDHYIGMGAENVSVSLFIRLPREEESAGRELIFFDAGPAMTGAGITREIKTFNGADFDEITDAGSGTFASAPQWLTAICDGEKWYSLKNEPA